ncbi:pyridoxamine 5'-phosphate oxidase family protein [Amycolatopsis rhabdoformis]|uniref:Pyridoxamine 5'-phosphate oxidase family protein n=1 Tax=Amycolatopsis rhabdoformis TaxID=1448059 RepID=A0ABZ1IHZ9_9PSEU|nr:pyridoxamine 5'-phosphate oxidase family protein [Amycolatopsis rhabdoformis]WSE34079.1 pyridoxamine 5'-phosphate oxidase family protein [Amycolatopsis rhabdoformis]
MTAHYRTVAFTAAVRSVQEHYGSRAGYARIESRAPQPTAPEPLTESEHLYLAEREGFYLASVGETGWPYVQYRGGPPGFLRVLDEHTVGWADFRGNLQYVSVGNLAGDDRVALIVMDYARRQRLKLFGRARVVDATAEPELLRKLHAEGDDGIVERGIVVTVEAYDWNCPQHITPRFSLAELEPQLERIRRELADLESENARLREELAKADAR